MKLKLALITALTFVSLVLPKSSSAFIADFSVRLGQPKTPTNQNNFKLTFVALDTKDTRNITVKCFKKGPSDGGFSQFDIDKVLIPGGNTDYCDVTNTILSSDGNYSFYVTATADSTTLTSSTVTVDYNTSGPGTPNSYSKERLNSCDYKIKFRTADDGKTVRVQLFRSDNLNISVGNSAVISGINIAPNTAGEIVNSVPDCGKDFYYVIRAVDSSDNVSGTIGDSFTTTTTIGSTTTNQTGGTANPTTGAIALNGANTALGKPAEGTATPTPENGNVSPTAAQGTPTVLGSSSDKIPFWKYPIFQFGVVALVGGAILILTRKKK